MENKRIVLINGDRSSWFEQAIIIVKDGQIKNCFEGGRPTPNLVEQAERIVNGYSPLKVYNQGFMPKANKGDSKPPSLETGNITPSKKTANKSGYDSFLNLIMIISCVALAGVLITQL